jgi:hypothetical protein
MADNINAPFFSSSFHALWLVCVERMHMFVKSIGITPRQSSSRGESPFSRCPIFIYRPAQRYDVESFAEERLKQGVSFSLSVPRKPGCYPLIVCLQARSEVAISSQELHRAWVEAGYALVVVSPEATTSFHQSRCPEVVEGEYARMIRNLIGQLRERDGAPFDRIDFETVVIAGTAISADLARALAGACNSDDPLRPHAHFPYLLVIADVHTRQLSEDILAGASLCHDLVIAVPGGEGQGGMIRHDFHPLPAPGDGTCAYVPVIPSRTAIRHLSLGFLDGAVKRDSTAIEWLERDAGRWLEPVGDLHMADTVRPSQPVAVDCKKRPKITPASTAP